MSVCNSIFKVVIRNSSIEVLIHYMAIQVGQLFRFIRTHGMWADIPFHVDVMFIC